MIFYHREVVTDLIDEYKAAERPDYVTWGSSTSSSSGMVNIIVIFIWTVIVGEYFTSIMVFSISIFFNMSEK